MKCPYCSMKFKQTQLNQKSCRLTDDCKLKESMAYIEKQRVLKEKKQRKEKTPDDIYWDEKKKEHSSKKNTLYLRDEVNKLARMIDAKFGYLCIDCGKDYGKQIDAAHFHNSQGNENIRWNLHNLHSAKSDCNQFSSEHKVGYRIGLEKRYGKEYLEMVEGLGLKYPRISLNHVEIAEKLKITRKLIRDFDTFILSDGIQARDIFNQIIGIYK